MAEPKDVTAYRKGVQLFKSGKTLEALKYFKYAAETGVDRPMEHFALASAYVRVGDLLNARREYLKFLEFESGMEQQEKVARQTLEKIKHKLEAAKAEPDSSEKPTEKEQASAEDKQAAQAREAEEKRRREEEEAARKKEQEELEAVRKLYDEAVNYYRAGGFSAALQRLEALGEKWGQTPEVLNIVGLCHLRLQQYQPAQEALERVLKEEPHDEDALVNLARTRFERGLSEASELLVKVTSLHSRKPQGWFNLGLVRLGQNDLESAVECWERVLELDPDDEAAKANLDMVKRRLT